MISNLMESSLLWSLPPRWCPLPLGGVREHSHSCSSSLCLEWWDSPWWDPSSHSWSCWCSSSWGPIRVRISWSTSINAPKRFWLALLPYSPSPSWCSSSWCSFLQLSLWVPLQPLGLCIGCITVETTRWCQNNQITSIRVRTINQRDIKNKM